MYVLTFLHQSAAEDGIEQVEVEVCRVDFAGGGGVSDRLFFFAAGKVSERAHHTSRKHVSLDDVVAERRVRGRLFGGIRVRLFL